VTVEGWLQRKYPKIRLKARQEGVEIHWCDEMGVNLNYLVGTNWTLAGERLMEYGTGKCFHCNMISS